MKKRNDSVFLLTLVDLLVQIIFLGIFVGAIYITKENTVNNEIKKLSEPAAHVVVEVGIVKVTEIVDSMVKLVPIDRIMELSVILPEFKSIENLKAALRLLKAAKYDNKNIELQAKELERKSTAGIGLPFCILGPEKSKHLFRLQGLENSYVLTMITPKAQELLNKFQLYYKDGDHLTNEQIDALGTLINKDEKECRYSVTYEPVIDSLKTYRRISKYFHPSIIHTGVGATK